MDNPTKNILVRNTQDNKVVSLTRSALTTLKSRSENFFWVEAGYDNPKDVLPCWNVTEKEKNNSIKNQRLFCERTTTDNYFKISKQIDNIHIEGYLGRNDSPDTFHDKMNMSLTYFEDYQKRKKVYFTFDRVSLYQVMEIFPENPFKFILKRIDTLKAFKKDQAFMIMPFRYEEVNKLYTEAIKLHLKEHMNIDIYRSDDFRDNDIIVNTIYTLIEESEFIIADTTFENKNAFYELGYASSQGKEIITIQNKEAGQQLFFDRAHIRTILYDLNNLESFLLDLTSTIKSIRDRQ